MVPIKKYGRSRKGSIYGLLAIALLALMGMAAFSLDLGRVVIAAQRAQAVADAAALAGASAPVTAVPSATYARISATVTANNQARGPTVTWQQSETTLYAGGQTIPGYGTLGSYEEGVRLATHVEVPYYFARGFGITGTTVTRRATAVRTFALGAPICPMWISYGTEYRYGETQNLLMADGPHYANIPGNFGFLSPKTGSNDFDLMLRGYQVPPEKIIGNYVQVNEFVYAYTGLSVGQWSKALQSSNDGLARLQRATWEPWAGDTFESYHRDNPRILIVPMCEYLDGTGSNARFRIKKFGAFWLESVSTSGQKSITGRFIQFQMPGASGDALAEYTGLWRAKLVK